MVVKFTFQCVFGNSLQNPRHFSARGREESLELYSILWSDWPTSKQELLRHGNRFVARVRRRYFSEGEKRRPEMRLRFAGYTHLGSKGFFWDAGFSRLTHQRLCHASSCLRLLLPTWYSCAHAWVTGPAVGWSIGAPCLKFALFSMQSS